MRMGMDLTPFELLMVIALIVIVVVEGIIAREVIRLADRVDAGPPPPPPPPTADDLPTPAPAVYVVTTEGETLRGALVTVAPDRLVLRHAALATLQEGAHAPSWTPLDGDTVVPSSRVHYYQLVTAELLGG